MTETEQFEDRTRSVLRARETRTDPLTASKLQAARRRALDPDQPIGSSGWLADFSWTKAVIAAGSIAALAVIVPNLLQQRTPVNPPDNSATMLSAGINPGNNADTDHELYENLEFYEWLAAEES